MSLNEQASADRAHIAFFGLRNAGKSSVVNAVTSQQLSLVSDTPGTTTDPVRKAMEILPAGPVVVIDTPGIDDVGELGRQRVKRALDTINQTDVAVLIADGTLGLRDGDRELISAFEKKNIPYIVAYNKADLPEFKQREFKKNEIAVSAKTGENIKELRELIASLARGERNDKRICADLINSGDIVVLVTPIDAAAPKGRLILPQQQTLRDILDANAISLVTRETELPGALKALAKPPKLVITDSQAFGRVSRDVPPEILLTSFSILFARYKGDLAEAVRGAAMLDKLSDGDRVLISEGCTHHRQCGDIGTEKLPKWIREYTNKQLEFSFTSGGEFPDNLSEYALVVHCGGCMLNEREMKSRVRRCIDSGAPITNYGIAIAQIHGILRRSLEPFPEILSLLD